MNQVIIGLDVGTTATKAVAFGLQQPMRRVALREYPMLSPQRGWQVQDPGAVAAAALQAVRDVATGLDVVGISVSTAMHGLIGLDAANAPLTPLITWADGRATPQSRSLRTSGAAAMLYEISGVPVHPMTPLAKLMWFAENDPDAAAEVQTWVGLKDYVLLALTGQLVTELSSASGTGMLDRRRLRWSRSAVELAGVTLSQLPEILKTTDVLPLQESVAAQVGLPAGLPVVLGAGDGPLGNVGTGALAPGTVGLSLGTSGAARTVVSQPSLDPHGRLFCYALTEDLWVVGGAVSSGGSVLRWAREAFGADNDEQVLQWAADVAPGSDGLVMLPYLLAERAPLWNPDLPGAYLGVRAHHGRGHFVRAALEGVGLQLAAVVDSIDQVAPVTQVLATGGALRSPLWRQIVADCLGRPLTVSDGPAGTAVGAAALGLVALGREPDLGVAVASLQSEASIIQTPVAAGVYADVRARIPGLIRAYAEVEELFG